MEHSPSSSILLLLMLREVREELAWSRVAKCPAPSRERLLLDRETSNKCQGTRGACSRSNPPADVQVEKGMVLPEVSAQPLHPSVSDVVFAEAQLLQCDIHLTESDYEEGLVPLLLPHKN